MNPADSVPERAALPVSEGAMVVVPPGTVCRPPLVSAVLVVGGAPGRAVLARRAVDSFFRQVYAPKQLVIVNTTPGSVTSCYHPDLVEKHVEPGPSLGRLRNLGLDIAGGDWVVQWDDDDYSHPYRLVYQMAHRQEDRPVLLRHQVCVNIKASAVFVREVESGISRTLLHPNTAERYPDTSEAEDLQFWMRSWGHNRVVVANQGPFPSRCLHLAYWHGANLTPEPVWMGDLARTPYQDRFIGLTSEEQDYVIAVSRAVYGLDVRKEGANLSVEPAPGQDAAGPSYSEDLPRRDS